MPIDLCQNYLKGGGIMLDPAERESQIQLACDAYRERVRSEIQRIVDEHVDAYEDTFIEFFRSDVSVREAHELFFEDIGIHATSEGK